jgi:hypothetical protein
MFHNRHWRYYEAYYNDQSEIGQQLVNAQNEHFENEGLGVQLNTIEKLMENSNNPTIALQNEYVSLAANITSHDWIEKKFMMDMYYNWCCLWID